MVSNRYFVAALCRARQLFFWVWVVAQTGCSGRIEDASSPDAQNILGGAAGATAQAGGTTAMGGTAPVGGGMPMGGAATAAGGSPAGGFQSCGTPDCCVPLTLTAENLRVYQVNGSLVVYFIAVSVGASPTNTNEEWLIEASASTSAGGSVTCASNYSVPLSSNYAGVECPAIPLAAAPNCGTSVDVTLAVRSKRIESASGLTLCQPPPPGTHMTFRVAVECPTCNARQSAPCDVPSLTSCTSVSLGFDGSSHSLPCWCNLSPSDGIRRWMCAVA